MAGTDPTHTYDVDVVWTGNRGTGTSNYKDYGRDHTITARGKPAIDGSSDPAFRGDAARWNPEDLLVAAVSACHELWYLHLCAVNGIAVISYRDRATGTMVEDPATGGRFTRILLRPRVGIRPSDDKDLALRLHADAHAKCFIANSVNFPVGHDAVVAPAGDVDPDPEVPAASAGTVREARPAAASLAEVRGEIDRLDRGIVRLMAERGTFVEQAARFKGSRAAVAAPDRVEAVLGKVRALAGEAGLSAEVADATYRAMIAAFISVEQDEFDRMRANGRAG